MLKSVRGMGLLVGGLAVGMVLAGCSDGAAKPSAAVSAPTGSVPTGSVPGNPSSPAAPPPSASSVPSTPVAPTGAAGDAQHPTGSYLKTLLPTRAGAAVPGVSGTALPSGWVADDNDEHDSGPAAAATPAPSLVGAGTCDYLNAKGLDLAGSYSVAGATEPLNNGNSPAGVGLYAYPPGDAAKVLAEVRKSTSTTCQSFTAMQQAGAVTVDVFAAPAGGLGDEAVLVRVAPQGPYTGQENLLVRRGDLMVSVHADNSSGSYPDLSKVAAALLPAMG
ncbi:hypothetical protein OG455_34920 [Kitasatospora sp. NBC_01287]|uniref:hypothetical protein n=1 Tax=Kitasatospora sp. NBC_01287 TaxID=2903573 RepID=UPI0022513C20|nr:hypothetical protein [Kitasatospora sp. NBC_01287]MCX4750641.1 hypothetical protein [Kitasatospora sp. NBC_01287]